MTREDIIKHIINTYNPTNAKEFEILGRAIKGCELIAIMDDGRLYYPGKLKNTNADWEALRLINNAIKELEQWLDKQKRNQRVS